MTRFIILLFINAVVAWIMFFGFGRVFRWRPSYDRRVEQAIARLGLRLWVALLAVSFAAIGVCWIVLLVELIQAGLALTRAVIG
jgi:hypothetical protein